MSTKTRTRAHKLHHVHADEHWCVIEWSDLSAVGSGNHIMRRVADMTYYALVNDDDDDDDDDDTDDNVHDANGGDVNASVMIQRHGQYVSGSDCF